MTHGLWNIGSLKQPNYKKKTLKKEKRAQRTASTQLNLLLVQ
jgi:hypothetical protein